MGIKPKYEKKTGTVASAEDAITGLTEIRDEIQEVVEGASGTNRENTQRIQTLGESVEAMGAVDDGMPELSQVLLDLKIEYQEMLPKTSWGRTYLSRADYVSNYCAVLEAAVEALRGFIDDEQARPEGVRQELIDEAEQAADGLQKIADECGAAEFPSMMG